MRYNAKGHRLEPVTFDEEPEAAAVEGEELPWNRMLSDELTAALDHLGPRHRLLVFLADIEELRYREIAQILGVPMGTVMSGLHAARTRLKDELLKSRVNKPDSGTVSS